MSNVMMTPQVNDNVETSECNGDAVVKQCGDVFGAKSFLSHDKTLIQIYYRKGRHGRFI